MSFDRDAYRERSRTTWGQMAEGWEDRREWMVRVTGRVNEWLAEQADPQPGQTFLEVACGTGDLGFIVAERVGAEGRVISTDFAPEMVDVARRQAEARGVANVEHRVLDAERMDLDDGSVDGAVCRWGYMLMAHPAAALRETRRVLRDGGGLVLSVWGSPQRNPWASLPGRALLECTGAAPPDPTAPGIFAMADPERTRSLLAAAGFEVQRWENLELSWRFQDFDAYWRFLTQLAGAIALSIANLTDEKQRALRARVEEAVAPYRSNDAYEIPGLVQNTLAA